MTAPQFVPEELKLLDRWCVWLRVGDSKRPFGPVTGRAKDWQDNLTNYGNALAALDNEISFGGEKRKPDGVGFRLGDGYVGIDLDCCMFERNGQRFLRKWAAPIVRQARDEGAWVEVSVSGDGLHIVMRASGSERKPAKGKWVVEHDPSEPAPRKPCQIEAYADSQYFTVSGNHASGGKAEDIGCAPKAWALALAVPEAGAPRDSKEGAGELVEADDDDLAADPRGKADGANPGGNMPAGKVTGPMSLVNAFALARANDLVPQMFPGATFASGAWKISPDETGGAGGSTNYISVHPEKGIKDFAAHKREGAPMSGGLSMIGLLLPPYSEFVDENFQGCATATQAALKLCDTMEMSWLKGMFKDEPEAVEAGGLVNVLEMEDEAVKVPGWPVGVLPAGLEAYARHVARRRAADEAAGCFMHFVTTAAAIPRGVLYDVTCDAKDKFLQSTSIYALLAGRSGLRKSPLMSAALRPIEDWEKEQDEACAKAFAEFKSQQAGAEKAKKRRGRKSVRQALQESGELDAGAFAPADDASPGGNDDEAAADPRGVVAPVCRYRLMGKTTVEALTAEFDKPNEGFIIHADELAGFIGGLDKYSQGSRGGSADSAEILKAYDGSPMRSHTVARGRVKAQSHLSIIGGIQPAVLAPMLENLGSDGLLQRFFACVMQAGSGVDVTPMDDDLADNYAEALRLLLEIRQTQGEVMLLPTPDAVAVWRELEAWTLGAGMKQAASETERGFVGKLPQMTARFAAALHCIEWAWREASFIVDGLKGKADPLPAAVSAETMRKAVRLAREFALPHARALYDLAVKSVALDDAKIIARKLLTLSEKEAKKVTARMIYRDLRRFEENRGRMDAAIRILQKHGWLSAEQKSGKSAFWTLDPKVRAFAEAAA